MADQYTTVEGDTVDLIAWKLRRQTRKVDELIFDANPGLAEYGPVLPAGLVVNIPPPPTQKPVRNVKRIWS